MGQACVIGPYARTRPGTVPGEDVHLGNFVEVKNSTIADHSKANHLALCGRRRRRPAVNVGAGTITCNYDGANKFRTIIEDDVFIGSDTQLVAPVHGKAAPSSAPAPPSPRTPRRTAHRVARQADFPTGKRPVKARKA